MNSWSLYETRLKRFGETHRDRIIERERSAIVSRAESQAALKTVEINGESRQLIVSSTNSMSEKTFSTLPGETVSIGDIILWNKLHWLVDKVDFDDEITMCGHIVQCNRQIWWQNSTGDIVSRWCLVTKPYTSNINEGMVIATSNRQFKVQVPYDSETIMIDLDKRFLLEMIGGEAKAYKVVSVDAQTNKFEDVDGGFLVWNLEQCEFNSLTDNVDLMIADYFNPSDEPAPAPPPPLEGLSCSILGRDTIRYGMQRTYRCVFLNADGEDVSDKITTVWYVDAPNNCATHFVEGGCLSLVASDSDSAVGSTVSLTATDADSLYPPAELLVEVIGLL